jgi:hypothetical protein
MNSINNTPKGEMQKKLKEILDTEEYRHQYAHFFDGTTKILSSTELEVIYPILMTNILSNVCIPENPQTKVLMARPICPIT